MELKVGMYVRTDDGIIGKIYEQIGDMFTYKNNNRDYITYGSLHNEIVKASYNLIDLIELGDYVNDYPVVEITNHQILGKKVCTNSPFDWNINEEKINSIVTKEQFESMKYIVEE